MNIIGLINQLLIPIIITIGVFVIGLYLVSYLTRFVRFLKVKENPIIGDEGLNILEIILFYTVFSFLFIIIVLSFAFSSHELSEYTTKIIFPYFDMFFLIMLILLFSFLLLTINSRTFKYLRGELHIKPKNQWSLKLATYVELFIKYLIYIFTLILIIIIFLAGLGLLRNTVENIYIFASRNIDGFITMAVIILGGILTYLFISAYLRDIRLKSKANKEKIFLYITGILKHFISIVVIVGIILIFLSMIGFMFADIFVFIVFIIFLIFSFAMIFTTPVINAISGFSILMTEPYVIGEYVKIDEINLMGEIIDIKLTNTIIKDYRGNILYIPNSKMMNMIIQNIGSKDKIIPIKIEFFTEENVNNERIEECIMKNKISENIVYDIKPKANLLKIDGKKKFYEITVYIDDFGKMDDIRTRILELINSCVMHD